MSISPQRPQKRKKRIEEGVNFILDYFTRYNNTFTRVISTQALPRGSPKIIRYKNEMFRPYEQPALIDCKVSVSLYQRNLFNMMKIPRKK
jgi:hypothetical protein